MITEVEVILALPPQELELSGEIVPTGPDASKPQQVNYASKFGAARP
jgi:hypothetical protein